MCVSAQECLSSMNICRVCVEEDVPQVWRTLKYVVWVYKKMSFKCEEHLKQENVKHMSCECTRKCLSSVKNKCRVCVQENLSQMWGTRNSTRMFLKWRTYVTNMWVYKKKCLSLMWRTYVVWVYKKMSLKCEEHMWCQCTRKCRVSVQEESLKCEEHMPCEYTRRCPASVKNICHVSVQENVSQIWRTYVVWVYNKMSLKCEEHMSCECTRRCLKCEVHISCECTRKSLSSVKNICRVSIQEDVPQVWRTYVVSVQENVSQIWRTYVVWVSLKCEEHLSCV